MSKEGQGGEVYFNLSEIFGLFQDVTFHYRPFFNEFYFFFLFFLYFFKLGGLLNCKWSSQNENVTVLFQE